MRRESKRNKSNYGSTSRSSSRSSPTENKRTRALWFTLLGFWMVFLTGILNDVTGSPGALQAFRLRHMLSNKNSELGTLEVQIQRLEGERHRLEDSTAHQEREIRRVLGYAAPGEIIFDFSRGLL